MVSYLDELTVTEAENLKKTIRDLFRQTCILQVKYDPVTLTPRDNPRYEICMRHKGFIEEYLSVLGCELKHDPQEHIFRLEGEGAATERMSMTTTLLVLILKLIYRDKILGEGLHATVTNLAEGTRQIHAELVIERLHPDTAYACMNLLNRVRSAERLSQSAPFRMLKKIKRALGR